jgi:beta-galactosidase/beta-glucuronidase
VGRLPRAAFLDACARLGLLVVDEAFDQWNESKENNQQDCQRFFKDWMWPGATICRASTNPTTPAIRSA